MCKKINILFVGLLCAVSCMAQGRFDQGFGLGYSRGSITQTANITKGTAFMRSDMSFRIQTAGIVYMLRRDLLGWKGGSVSVGAPVMAGMAWTTRYRSTDNDGTTTYQYGDSIRGTSITFDLPLVADLNIGMHSAADESRSSFGLYAGVGYAYSYARIKTSVGKLTLDGFEPLLRAGIRWGSAWERRWCLALTMRGDWTQGANKIYGVQLLKEL